MGRTRCVQGMRGIPRAEFCCEMLHCRGLAKSRQRLMQRDAQKSKGSGALERTPDRPSTPCHGQASHHAERDDHTGEQ